MYTLYVMMGYPGCGKTTIAKNTLKFLEGNPAIYSSDDIREELFGYRDQLHNDEVFKVMHERVIKQSFIGDCIYDATNMTKKSRRNIVDKFKKYYTLKLICVLKPILQLVDINSKRYNTKEYIPENIFKNI